MKKQDTIKSGPVAYAYTHRLHFKLLIHTHVTSQLIKKVQHCITCNITSMYWVGSIICKWQYMYMSNQSFRTKRLHVDVDKYVYHKNSQHHTEIFLSCYVHVFSPEPTYMPYLHAWLQDINHQLKISKRIKNNFMYM